MATYSANFSLDGTDYSVLSCNYFFNQGTNTYGQPSTDVMGGTISLQIASSEENSLIGWMVDPTGKKNGSITFQKSDGGGTLKEVKFEEGICVGYSESFSSGNDTPMIISLNITAKKVSVGDATVEKNWAGS